MFINWKDLSLTQNLKLENKFEKSTHLFACMLSNFTLQNENHNLLLRNSFVFIYGQSHGEW